MPAKPIPRELKEQALLRLLPPYSWSLRQVANEIGTAPSTIFNWRKQLEDEGLLMPNEDKSIEYSADQIFTFVLETAVLSEYELVEYCRKHGLYLDQIKGWKKTCISANVSDSTKRAQFMKESRVDKKRIKELEKELQRKDKALAETAALLVLREKFNAQWEDKEDE